MMRTEEEIDLEILELTEKVNFDAKNFLMLAQCYHERAVLALKSGKKREALQFQKAMFEAYHKAAEAGYSQGMYQLAFCYQQGRGVRKDLDQAFIWYKEAALKRDPYAQYQLACCYENGEGTEQNLIAAVKWYQEVARYLKDAQFALGECFRKGLGVAQNDEQAFHYYQQAATKGLASASYQVAAYLLTGIPASVEKDEQEAIHYLRESAEKGYTEAQYRLALFYADGYLVENNADQAFYWWKQAADNLFQPHALALWYVADCFAKGFGCVKNQDLFEEYHQRALHYLEEIKNKNLEAQHLLARVCGEDSPGRLLMPPANLPVRRFVKSYSQCLVETLQEVWNRALHSNMNILHLTAMQGNTNLLQQYLDSRQYLINEYDRFGHTPLDYAVVFGHVDCVGILLDAGIGNQANIEEYREIVRALELAVAGNYSNIIYLLSMHQFFNAVLRTQDEVQDTLIHVAARFDSVDALSTLIGCSQAALIDPNTYNNEGMSPFHLAAQFGSYRVLRYLIILGIDIHIKTETGKTALYLAIENDQAEIVNLLLSKGIEIDPEAEQLARNTKAYYAMLDAEKRARVERDKNKKSLPSLSHVRNLVFKGGGVKGIGHVGALIQLQEAEGEGFFGSLIRVAGTSAGAINAFGLAIGFTPEMMKEKTLALDFKSFMDSENQEFVDLLISAVNQGLSVEKMVQAVVPELSQIYSLGKKGITHAAAAVKHFAKKNIFSGIGRALKGAAYGVVLQEAYSEQKHRISEAFTRVKDIFTLLGKEYGIFPGKSALELFQNWAREQQLPEDLTFSELAAKHRENPGKYKLLYLVCTNLSQVRTEIFSHEHTPDVLVVDAVRASMSIPIFFQPYQLRHKKGGQILLYSQDHYIDGGVLYNYPVDLFDQLRYQQSQEDVTVYQDGDAHIHNRETLGFCLVTGADKLRFNWKSKNPEESGDPIANLASYFFHFMSLYINHEENAHARGHDQPRTIHIPSLGIGTVDFALDRDKQETLLQSGELSTRKFVENLMPSQITAQASNRQLMSYLAAHAQMSWIITPRGLDFREIKLSIRTPRELYELLLYVNTTDERALFSNLPLDLNCKEKATQKTILHLALENLNKKEEKRAAHQVLVQLFKLHKINQVMLDCNVRDGDDQTALDKAWNITVEADKFWSLLKLVKAGAVTARNIDEITDFFNPEKNKMPSVELSQRARKVGSIFSRNQTLFQANPMHLSLSAPARPVQQDNVGGSGLTQVERDETAAQSRVGR